MQKPAIAVTACTVFLGAASLCQTTLAGVNPPPAAHVRTSNRRIADVLREALRRSESFRDLIATLEGLDRTVYVEEAKCDADGVRSCLHIVKSRDSNVLLISVDPRQSTRSLIAQLAHELYHAVEIASEPDVVDGPSMRALLERIGYRTCSDSRTTCWETRAACAFEDLVTRQIAQ